MARTLIVCLVLLIMIGCGRDLDPSNPKYSDCPKCNFSPRFLEQDVTYDEETDKLRITCYQCEYQWLVPTKDGS
jgi:DNA-directed RNA polymerase subunit RPC12/RpoP